MSIFDQIRKPTLLLDEEIVRRNIRTMAKKAAANGVHFRPHFKTHQSCQIGEWFRAEGVQAITVSSVDMAKYFADCGWEDITLAFPVNLRQLDEIAELAGRIRLGVLVESVEVVHALGQRVSAPLSVWIKVDVGARRTGILWDDVETASALVKACRAYPSLHLKGLLTHAGQTYQAAYPVEVEEIYRQSLSKLQSLRHVLQEQGWAQSLLLSVGDTPACSIVQDFHPADEVRPGNFVFYDVQQWMLGACTWEQIAVALVCPVVSLHPRRGEAVIYGGAIHLSKEFLLSRGQRFYGLISLPKDGRWGEPLPGAYVARLSQEHGILRLFPHQLEQLRVGDLVCVLPVHSCLTAQAMGRYLTLDGVWIEMMPHP